MGKDFFPKRSGVRIYSNAVKPEQRIIVSLIQNGTYWYHSHSITDKWFVWSFIINKKTFYFRKALTITTVGCFFSDWTDLKQRL